MHVCVVVKTKPARPTFTSHFATLALIARLGYFRLHHYISILLAIEIVIAQSGDVKLLAHSVPTSGQHRSRDMTPPAGKLCED